MLILYYKGKYVFYAYFDEKNSCNLHTYIKKMLNLKLLKVFLFSFLRVYLHL